jgi:HPt (histidine-containing phosphotransfer) domain-containing protein
MTVLGDSAEPYFLDVELAVSQIGDVQTMQGMLTMLEETLARDVPLIAQLLESGDHVAANRLLHPLKGFIPIFCGEAICAHVSKVEEMSKFGPSSAVLTAYRQLQVELEQLMAEVSIYLNESGGTY